jgi:hypothetical protein
MVTSISDELAAPLLWVIFALKMKTAGSFETSETLYQTVGAIIQKNIM